MRNPSHVAFGRDPAVLRRILEPEINLAVWRRRLPRLITSYINALVVTPETARGHYLNRQYVGGDEFFPREARGIIGRNFVLREPEADAVGALKEDVLRCFDLFCGVASEPRPVQLMNPLYAAMRIWFPGEQRQIFHEDGPDLRMIVTYRGRGTEWLPNWAVNREAVGARETTDEKICRDPKAIRCLKRGDVAIFKGSQDFGTESTLIHRPPLVRPGEIRILFVANN